MTKREICTNKAAIAYYSGYNGIEIHHIEYGINDFVYYVSSAWYGGKSAKKYHKSRIYYGEKSTYFKYNGIRISLDDCICM